MFKKLILPVFVAMMMTGGMAYGQAFEVIAPSDLGLAAGSGTVNGIFDISGLLGVPSGSASVQIVNGNISSTDTWTVAENNPSTFILSGSSAVEVFINHGANLGSENFQNGSLARDGVTSAAGESFTLTSTLDPDYTFGQEANDFFVDYTGPETDQVESNSTGFVFVSDQPVSSFTVFSSNTTDFNNDYTLGFRATAVPEPASGMLLAFAGLFVLRRKRS